VIEMPKVIHEDEVFKAVLEVLMARGYDSATTAEMAAAAKIHEATLFRKYGSKARLVELAIENQLSDTPLNKVRYTGNLRDDLKAILQAYVDTVEKHGEIIPVILLEIPRHPELRNTLQAPMANLQGIANIITRYQQEGLLKNEPPMSTVNFFIGPIMVNQMILQANIDLPTAAIDLQEYVERFLHGRELV
jgi:AcrR family transcriptional regulator